MIVAVRNDVLGVDDGEVVTLITTKTMVLPDS